eukprot:3955399-Pleurochrysis_carterae.AAC.1
MPAPVPGSNAPKPLANIVTRKEGGRGSARRKAPGLLEAFSFCRQSLPFRSKIVRLDGRSR